MKDSSDQTEEESRWRRQIAALEEEGRKAFLAADTGRLRALFADELLVNSPVHRVHDKAKVLELLERGIVRHSSSVERIEVMERLGDVVVVMGEDVVTDPPENAPVRRRFTNVWRAEGDSWRLIVRQATPIAPPSPKLSPSEETR
ncbi:MAG TPA: nuclear transport factor 2 family protein [Thermoanaerobaculia bacterium]|jgi:ketosteroid isomerase-like protein